MTITFENATAPSDYEAVPDSVPETEGVECPCKNCGREAGPYGGRGPKPKICADCKPTVRSTKRVTGKPAELASQATAVLVQVNGLAAMGLMSVGMFATAKAIAGANDTFEQQAYAALVTDPELCKLILKSGVKSAKLSLGLAYVGMGIAVVPTAMMEAKEKKAERDARREAELSE